MNDFYKKSSNTTPPKKEEFSDSESLLLNDVYGKKDSSEFCSKSNTYTETNKKTNASAESSGTNDFSSLFQSFLQGNSESNTSSNSMPDIETILKFKKIFDRIQSKSGGNDPIVNLLYAFKPFMQESKRSIIDQIAKFMTISTVLQDFNGFL